MPHIVVRSAAQEIITKLISHDIHPVLARIYAARGIHSIEQLPSKLDQLIPFSPLRNISQMAQILVKAIQTQQRLLVIADYDCDGATACAVAVRALRAFGAKVEYLVPNRFDYGYGLTPEIVKLAATRKPDILITVDNGIASVEGVNEANRQGIEVLITDHHLPGDVIPTATCIVNPNQMGCDFPSKNLAGVGVIFYVMLALRTALREIGYFENKIEPNLAILLDLVALGTVADVVKLDNNNRLLVSQGLHRIRAGKIQPGIRALFTAAGKNYRTASAYDLGFVVGPRLNAAGRLEDMSLGIECLISDDEEYVANIATQLDNLNRERREIESAMKDQALASLETIEVSSNYTLSLFNTDWHQGVIGILASRLRDKFHRPTIIFARGKNGELKGSGRSIKNLHLRDALDLVYKRHPDLILGFGGHASAAGLTIRENNFQQFCTLFEETVRTLIGPTEFTQAIETDGILENHLFSIDLVRVLEREVWGAGFPAPLFNDRFSIAQQSVVADKHLKLKLNKQSQVYDAILFNHAEPLPNEINSVFRLAYNDYSNSLQLVIEHWQPV